MVSGSIDKLIENKKDTTMKKHIKFRLVFIILVIIIISISIRVWGMNPGISI